MKVDDGLLVFAQGLQQEVLDAAALEGEGASPVDAFTQRMLSELTQAAVLDDGEVVAHQARGVAINAYSLDDDDLVVDLLVTVYTGVAPPVSMGRTDVESAFTRLRGFLALARRPDRWAFPPGSPQLDMAHAVNKALQGAESVRLFLLTDGAVKAEHRDDEFVDGLTISHHVWDLIRLHRCVTSGQGREPIEIDFREFGGPIPCLRAPGAPEDYSAYLAIFPGTVLSAVYSRFGPRLLELNVRSFLQARGKVNAGIRQTLRTQPDRFLAYNNGISATASSVEIVDLPSGGQGIAVAHDLQIVNGAQTTASIHNCARTDSADLSRVYVQAKVTVVSPEDVRDLVPLISRYANSQNKVNEADFLANDPFHVRLEDLSRTIWAPPAQGSQAQTRWFYERARGQYQDAVNRELTPARQRDFKLLHPPAQKFVKTDVAKWEQTWDQLPHVVSLGNEKNFRAFTIRLAERSRGEPNASYFHNLVAKGIVWRHANELVRAERFGGYVANIVAYTMALLANRSSQRIDLDAIWQRQEISPAFADLLRSTSHLVHDTLVGSAGSANVTEWCKRLACWERVRGIELTLPPEFAAELLSVDRPSATAHVSGIEAPDAEESAEIDRVMASAAETWFAVARWAKQTDNLQPWQRSIAFSIGKLVAQQRRPSRKQAHQGCRMLEEATRLGFAPAEVGAEGRSATG